MIENIWRFIKEDFRDYLQGRSFDNCLVMIECDIMCVKFDFVATNGVVLASEKKHKSLLYDGTSVWKIESVNPYIGMCYSGKFVIRDENNCYER